MSWHTLPLRLPAAVEEQKQDDEWIENESFYKQLVAKKRNKSTISTLARLLAKHHWNKQDAQGRTTLGDIRIREEYKREFGEAENNVYTCVARLMTPTDIWNVLEELGEENPHAFFNVNPIATAQKPLDHAGLSGYLDHSWRGAGPQYHVGNVRRLPSHFRARANAGDPWEATGLDPTMHWGEEHDNAGRQLMACCGTPVQGKGAVPGCWIRMDKTQEYGVIVPYEIMTQENVWQNLSTSAFDEDALALAFKSDIVTGTAFLDRDYYAALDRDIRTKWNALVPRLVQLYHDYSQVLDAAIQSQQARLTDLTVVHAPKGSVFWKDATALYRLICQFNKPQHVCQCYSDTREFINRHLIKVHLALLHFNEETRGFIMFDGVKINKLKAAPTIDELDELYAKVDGYLQRMVYALRKFIQLSNDTYEPQYEQIVTLQYQLAEAKVKAVKSAYGNMSSAKNNLVSGINIGLIAVSKNDPAGPPKKLMTALTDATNAFIAASDAISIAEETIATAQKRIDDGRVSLALDNADPTFKKISRLQTEAAVKITAVTKKIQATSFASGELNAVESAKLKQLVADMRPIEETLAQLLIQANKQKLLIQEIGLLANVEPADMAEALAQIKLNANTTVIAPLQALLRKAEALNADSVVEQLVLDVNTRRSDQQKLEAAERTRLLREKQVKDTESLRLKQERERAAQLTQAQKDAADAVAARRRALVNAVDTWASTMPEQFLLYASNSLYDSSNNMSRLEPILATQPPLSKEELTFLVRSKLFTRASLPPRGFDIGYTSLGDATQNAYPRIFLKETPLTRDETTIVQTTWRHFVDWLLYRGTSEAVVKLERLKVSLADYGKLVPSQPVKIDTQMRLEYDLVSRAADLAKIRMPDTGMFHLDRIEYNANSCWMDSAFTALFSYPGNYITKHILEATKGVRIVRQITFDSGPKIVGNDCTVDEMQSLHGAIVDDALQLVNAGPARDTCLMMSKFHWEKCVLGSVQAGKRHFAESVFRTLKANYDMQNLDIVYGEPGGALSVGPSMREYGPELMVRAVSIDGLANATKVNVEMANIHFQLGAIICGTSAHYATYLYDFYLRTWFFINVLPNTFVVNVGLQLPDNVHHLKDDPVNNIKAPSYPPAIYVYYRKSMLVDLIKQKAPGTERTVAVLELGGEENTPVQDVYAQFLSALEPTVNVTSLNGLMRAADAAVFADMDACFKRLGLVHPFVQMEKTFENPSPANRKDAEEILNTASALDDDDAQKAIDKVITQLGLSET